MYCPLCREKVSDENQLQVHYLMSCTGYVDEASINTTKQVSRSNVTAVVQFRWVKSKPTLAREVYLISSLAESINLTWSEVEECFLSQPTNVPTGLHSCQLIVDSDPMSTEDFEISHQSKIVNIMISEGSISGGNPARESPDIQPPPPAADPNRQTRQTRESSVERRTTETSERPSQKGRLYEELVTHQLLHGDSFGEFANDVQPNEGRRLGSARARANGLAHITNDSSDFQQFLRPSLTSDDQQDPAVNEDSEEDNDSLDPPENGEVNEERTSSAADSADISQSLSSHEDLDTRTRPLLLGSDTINGDQELQIDSGSGHEHTPVLNGRDNQEESPQSFVHVERDHEESADGQEYSFDGDDHEEDQDDENQEEEPDHHNVPDGHEEEPGDHDSEEVQHGDCHEEVPLGDGHEEVPLGDGHEEVQHGDGHEEVQHGDGHEEVQHGDGHEEVPHGDDHEEVPLSDDHEEVPLSNDHEEVPHGDDHEEVPLGDDHEEVPHSDDHEEVPHGDNHQVTTEDHLQEEPLNINDLRTFTEVPNPVTQTETPILDPHTEQPEGPFPGLDARNHKPFWDDNQVLSQQRERQPSRGVAVTRPSSAPTFLGREPEGGNEDVTRRQNDGHQSGYGNISLGPSAPPASDTTLWQSSDRAGAWVPGTGSSFQRRERNTLFDDSHVETLVRHSPAGSVFGDQEIRRPPLYTSAPSRPQSSPPYPTQDRPVISPQVSPRIGNHTVTSATRLGRSSGGAVHENITPSRSQHNPTTSLDGFLNRQTPMGSARTVGSSSVVSGSYRPSTELWSDQKIKELLDSLKQPPRRTSAHSSENLANLRERQQNSEVTALKTQLVEREEYAKKLKTKNSVYEKEILKLRAKELELAKAFSLAESSRATAKEQEDIVRQLTQALNMKEKECSGLERKVLDMKQTQRLLESEAESRKKVNEIRVQELRSVQKSLSDEVKTLRQDSVQHSSVYTNKFKKLQEDFLERCAVNNSLRDQVKLLEEEKAELQRNLRRTSTEMEELKTAASATSPYEKKYTKYASTASETAKHSRDLRGYDSRSTAVNSYLGTSETSKFIARHQSNGEAQTSHQSSSAIPGNYDFPSGSRNGQSKVTGYGGKPAGSYRNDVRVERHDGGTSPRSRFELESYPVSASSWRRKDSSGDVVSSEGSSYIGVGRYMRSYSSDSISTSSLLQNGLSVENSRSHDRAKLRDGYDQDVEAEYRRKEGRRRERPHSYHSGSYENLATPQTFSSQFSVRGHRLNTSPISPATSDVSQAAKTPSPKKGKPFAPNTPQEIDQGMKVLVTRACGKTERGKVKFVGYLPTKKDIVYLGLELEREVGKHDGEFQGERYFKCKRNHGIFVPFTKVVMAYT